MKKIIILILAFLVSVIVFLNFSKNSRKNLYFEDVDIIVPEQYVNLITPESTEVRKIANRVQDPVKAYYYVRDFILFNPSMTTNSPDVTISLKEGNCLSKAVLLVSLYRALGIPEGHVRIIIGELHSDRMPVQHAWIEVKYNGTWFQQDPTDLIGVFEFNQFSDRDYFRKFVRTENFCFNDTGFAVVSQKNRFRFK